MPEPRQLLCGGAIFSPSARKGHIQLAVYWHGPGAVEWSRAGWLLGLVQSCYKGLKMCRSSTELLQLFKHMQGFNSRH